jgi:hypothetical protein
MKPEKEKWDRKLGKLARARVKPKPEATTKTSIRVPKETWRRVKILAVEENKTVHALLAEAIDRLLEER